MHIVIFDKFQVDRTLDLLQVSLKEETVKINTINT